MSDSEEREAARSDAEEGAAPEPPKPAKRKKKKKRRPAPVEVPEQPRPTRDASGADRPQFLLTFPSHPELDRLVGAFEAGDYATVRLDAPKLAGSAEDPEVRDAALELSRRIAPDPLIRYLLVASIALLGFLVIYFYSHRH